MSILGTIITVEQLIEAETPALKELYDAVVAEFTRRDEVSAMQTAVAAVDVAVDVNEDLKFPRSSG